MQDILYEIFFINFKNQNLVKIVIKKFNDESGKVN